MTELTPEILAEAREGDAAVLQLRVPPGLTHFAGHFPGLPILPGIVQVDWAVRLARRHFQDLELSKRIENLKFQAMVRPGALLNLTLRYAPEEHSLEFTYREDARTCSSGRIRFEASA